MAARESATTKDTLVASLVKVVSIPKKANVLRLAGGGNARPSAIANPFSKPVLNWSTPPAAAQQLLPADEAIVVVTNDPLAAMIFTEKNPGAVLLAEEWAIGGSPDNFTIIVAPGSTPNLAQDLYASLPISPNKAWNGPRKYARLFKGRYYLWCDASTTPGATNILLVLTSAAVAMAAGDTVTINVYRLNEGDEILVSSTIVAGPVAVSTAVLTFQLPAADYYRVDLTGGDANTTAALQFNIQNRATSELVIHLALPDLSERQMNLLQAIRVYGASSHCMNLVSEQNATGSWVGDQPEGSVLWTSYLRGAAGANGFQKIASQAGNEVMELKKYNPYTFVTPETLSDWSYVHPFTFSASSQVTNVLHKSMEKFNYTITYLKSGGTAAGPDASRNIQMEFYFAVEYISDGLWPMLGVSPLSEDDVAAAVKILASMENITHNPAFGDILRTIGKYVRLSAPVLALLGPYGKVASGVASGVGGALGALGYRTKKTARPEEEQDRVDREAEDRKAQRIGDR